MNKTPLKPIIVFLLFFILAGCQWSSEDPTPPPSPHHHQHHDTAEMKMGTPLSGASIYQVKSQWKNQMGKSIKIEQLRGKTRVVAMAFTSCQYACPLIVADMKKIERNLLEAGLDDMGFVIFSIDPERDTPKALAKFAQKHQLPSEKWTLLTSDANSAQELAAVLGIKYKKMDNGDFSHSNLITVLDTDGIVRHQQIGLKQNPEKTLQMIKSIER